MLRKIKRVIVAIVGGIVVLIGIVMVILPGPAIIVIPAGLAILATEFLWARKAIRRCKCVTDRLQAHPMVRKRTPRWVDTLMRKFAASGKA